ncbi:hypothetical protein D3C86_1592610 [compost metagenome]
MQRGQRPAVAGKALPIAKRDIGHKSRIGTFGKGIGLAHMQRPGGAMRTLRHRQRPGCRLQSPGERRVITMGVADEDMGDLAAIKRRQQRLKMRLILRAGIDDGNGAVADDVAVGAVKGEGGRIVDGDALDERGDRNRLAIGRPEIEIECRVRHRDLLKNAMPA